MPAATNQDDSTNQSKTTGFSQKPVQPSNIISSGGKEAEKMKLAVTDKLEQVSSEVVLAPEVEKAGVVKIGETIELPPDVKKLGVTTNGSPVTVPASKPPSAHSMPLSDEAIYSGRRLSIGNTIRWLSEWCIRKLKKAHLVLRNIQGKIVRVKI